ncbi:MAG: mechanosensitive ion channel family protein [Elusimicrobia bacterium]|nr:mechanosensitive ion channel family protein [Candidatus Liberimonas magnetica]
MIMNILKGDGILFAAGVFVGVFITGVALRNIFFKYLSGWAKSTKTEIDDIVIAALKKPSLLWCVMLSLYFSVKYAPMNNELITIAGKAIVILAITSITFVLSNILTKLISLASKGIEKASGMASLTHNLTKIAVFSIGAIVILHTMGVSITPFLATLGVGGLAIALALQDTLSNLFAGFYIIVSNQVRVGDYIKLETGEEGYVADINWRTTKVRMLANNLILIPNDKLTKTIITNYHMPDKEMAVLINLGVHYNSDLNKVERITCETAKEIMKTVNGGVPEFEPFIRYHTFGDSSIQFTVILRVKEFVDQYLIKHEFVKKLHEKYKEENITIPYPIRAINYIQEKAELK